ncbi:MAG: hypothetical protein IPK83_18900 [Planctomycetes bacterium]|nr:hypothetical protein [Planctomycetota bacterium]
MSNQDSMKDKDSGNTPTAADIRQCLLHMETAMRMLGKAIHRFSELQLVHKELRYDPMWTGYEAQMQQALANVKESLGKI